MKINLQTDLAPIAVEILFLEERTKKIATESGK